MYKVTTAAILIQTRGVQSVFNLENTFIWALKYLLKFADSRLTLLALEYKPLKVELIFSLTELNMEMKDRW